MDEMVIIDLGINKSEAEFLRILGYSEEEISNKIGNTITVRKHNYAKDKKRNYAQNKTGQLNSFDKECHRLSSIRLACFSGICDTVYVLRLCSHKWYVGFTTCFEMRMHGHFSREKGAKMTKLYRPLEVMMIMKGDLKDEDQVTLEMMKIFGIDCVRGGRWHYPNLSQEAQDKLSKMVGKTKIKYINAEEEIMNFAKYMKRKL
jgi:predicted GIY-YIG superfamily endonuclease